MSAQNLKYNLPKVTFLDKYKCLSEQHYMSRKFDMGDEINIIDFVEILLKERINCIKI